MLIADKMDSDVGELTRLLALVNTAMADAGIAFVSDEFNGVTQDREGNVRLRVPRRFRSLSEAEEEADHHRMTRWSGGRYIMSPSLTPNAS